ncbi:MAG TPA: hypothetical protein VGB85_11635 [Nannocystis sp.]|jgi:hypothetical protein
MSRSSRRFITLPLVSWVVSCGPIDPEDAVAIRFDPETYALKVGETANAKILAVDDGRGSLDVTAEASLEVVSGALSIDATGVITATAPSFGTVRATWMDFEATAPVRIGGGWMPAEFPDIELPSTSTDALVSVAPNDHVAILLNDQQIPRITLLDPATGFTTPEPVGDATGFGEGVALRSDGGVLVVVREGGDAPTLGSLERAPDGTWTRLGRIEPGTSHPWRVTGFGANDSGEAAVVLEGYNAPGLGFARRAAGASEWEVVDVGVEDYAWTSSVVVNGEGVVRFAHAPYNLEPPVLNLYRAARGEALQVALTITSDLSIDCPLLAVDAEGDGWLAWFDSTPESTTRMRVAELRGDAVVGGPYDLPGDFYIAGSCEPQLVLDAEGRGLLLAVPRVGDPAAAAPFRVLEPGKPLPAGLAVSDDAGHLQSSHMAVTGAGDVWFEWYTDAGRRVRRLRRDGTFEPSSVWPVPVYVTLTQVFAGLRTGAIGVATTYENDSHGALVMTWLE